MPHINKQGSCPPPQPGASKWQRYLRRLHLQRLWPLKVWFVTMLLVLLVQPFAGWLLLLVMVLVGMLPLVWVLLRWKHIKVLTPGKKTIWALALLVSANMPFLAVEYALYLHAQQSAKTSLRPEAGLYLDAADRAQRLNLQEQSYHYGHWYNRYDALLALIHPDSTYPLHHAGGHYFVQLPQIILRLVPVYKRKGDTVPTWYSKPTLDTGYCALMPQLEAAEGDVLELPASTALAELVLNGHTALSGTAIIEALAMRLDYYGGLYHTTQEEIEQIETRGRSFVSFMLHNLLEKDKGGYTRSFYMKILMLLQVLVTLFLWGYLKKVIYLVFDDEA